jgi:hypothetical protein
MVWPLVAMAAVSVVATAYSEYQKGKISKRELEERLRLAKKYEEGLRAPPGTAEPFTSEEYAKIREFAPQIATFVQENRPSLVKEADSQREKRLQQDALGAYQERAQTGVDRIADAQREEALFEADARDKGRREAILRGMAARGLSGSGQDVLAQLQSSQDAAVGARQASLDAVKQAEARRIDALNSMANMASSVRGQNRQVEQTNIDIMNSYNQRLANAQNMYNQNVANTRNDAQRFNIGNEARVNMANTELRNTDRLRNLQREEAAREALREFENSKLRDVTNMQSGLAAAQGEMARDRIAGQNAMVQSGVSGASQVYSGMRADQAAEEEKMEREKDRQAYGGGYRTNRSAGGQ